MSEQTTANEVTVLSVEDDQLVIGERRLPLLNLRRTQRAWHELESAVKANKRRLTVADRERLEAIVNGEGQPAQRGWAECKQALEQAQLL